MSMAGLRAFCAVPVALELCTAKTITKPVVRLISSAPNRKPSSSRFGLGRKSITVTAASRLRLPRRPAREGRCCPRLKALRGSLANVQAPAARSHLFGLAVDDEAVND